jgi:hypothetical protein
MTTTPTDPLHKHTIRTAIVISNTPANQLLMGGLIEQAEAILEKAEGFAVIKCCSEETQFMGSPNKNGEAPEPPKAAA